MGKNKHAKVQEAENFHLKPFLLQRNMCANCAVIIFNTIHDHTHAWEAALT